MKKTMILVAMVLISVWLVAESYTGIPDFLPYGVDCIGSPKAPGWLQQKADPNGFQGAYYYDANGNYHEGRANPNLKVFYEGKPSNDLPQSEPQITRIEKMLKWIIKKLCDMYGYRMPESAK